MLCRLPLGSSRNLEHHLDQPRWEDVESSHRQGPVVVGLEHEVGPPLPSDVFAAKNLPGASLGHGHNLTEEESRPGQDQSQYDERRHQAMKRNSPGLGGKDLSMLRHGMDREHHGDQGGNRKGPGDEFG